MTKNMSNFDEVSMEAVSLLGSQKPSGINFVIITKDNDTELYHINPRFQQPCYGELTKYEDPHGEEDGWCNKYRPQDLFFPFPEGHTPVRVMALFYLEEGKDYSNFSLEESVWAAGFNKPRILSKKDTDKDWKLGNLPSGVYVIDTLCEGICATTFVHFLRTLRNNYSGLLDNMIKRYTPSNIFDYRDVVGTYDKTCLYYRGGQEEMFEDKHTTEQEMTFHE